MKTTAILLAGGQGTRMNCSTVKQFLELDSKPIALYSFHIFQETPEIDEIVVVCAPQYQRLFPETTKRVRFALPGTRRQDSVFHGLQAADENADYLCIHDGCRPFITVDMVKRVLAAGQDVGAATVGLPIRFTVKEVDESFHVKTTPERSFIWEIQTPQVIAKDLLKKGFDYAYSNHITVTDDVSLAELLGSKVKLVEGSTDNIKITIPTDLVIAKTILGHA